MSFPSRYSGVANTPKMPPYLHIAIYFAYCYICAH